MRFPALNSSAGQLHEVKAAGSDIFVKVGLYRRIGENAYTPHSIVDQLVPLDHLVALVADRLAVLDAAEAEEEVMV